MQYTSKPHIHQNVSNVQCSGLWMKCVLQCNKLMSYETIKTRPKYFLTESWCYLCLYFNDSIREYISLLFAESWDFSDEVENHSFPIKITILAQITLYLIIFLNWIGTVHKWHIYIINRIFMISYCNNYFIYLYKQIGLAEVSRNKLSSRKNFHNGRTRDISDI